MDIQQTLTVNRKHFDKFVLTADIGGTNARFGVVGVNSEFRLLWTFNFKTKEIDLIDTINSILEKVYNDYGIEISELSIGAAGRVDGNKVQLTNNKKVIDAQEILDNTLLGKVFLLNDFEAIAYGINTIDKEGIKVLIGPGTGLGKAILVWNGTRYVVLKSEGGHAEHSIKDDFSSKFKTWDELLSGKGLEKLYYFIRKKRKKAEDIKDKKVLDKFGEYLAVCSRNFVLDTMADKVYFLGGVAINHPEIFKKFRKHFEKGKFKDYLKTVEHEVISTPGFALIGAAYASTILEPTTQNA